MVFGTDHGEPPQEMLVVDLTTLRAHGFIE